MATNAQLIRAIQQKIDDIVFDLPRVVTRLERVLPYVVVDNLLTQDPSIGTICRLLAEDWDALTEPNWDEVVSEESLRSKNYEFLRLKGSVMDWFERLLTVLHSNTIFDLLAGTYANAGEEQLNIIVIFNEVMTTQQEEFDLSGALEELELTEVSSDDN